MSAEGRPRRYRRHNDSYSLDPYDYVDDAPEELPAWDPFPNVDESHLAQPLQELLTESDWNTKYSITVDKLLAVYLANVKYPQWPAMELRKIFDK